jgi:hypothetical protein
MTGPELLAAAGEPAAWTALGLLAGLAIGTFGGYVRGAAAASRRPVGSSRDDELDELGFNQRFRAACAGGTPRTAKVRVEFKIRTPDADSFRRSQHWPGAEPGGAWTDEAEDLDGFERVRPFSPGWTRCEDGAWHHLLVHEGKAYVDGVLHQPHELLRDVGGDGPMVLEGGGMSVAGLRRLRRLLTGLVLHLGYGGTTRNSAAWAALHAWQPVLAAEVRACFDVGTAGQTGGMLEELAEFAGVGREELP